MNKTPLKQIDEIEEVSVSESTPPECGEGFVYDEAEGKCVPIKKEEKRIEPVKIEKDTEEKGSVKDISKTVTPQSLRLGSKSPSEKEYDEWFEENPDVTQIEIDQKKEELNLPIDNSFEAIARRRKEAKEIKLNEVVVTAGEKRTDERFYPNTPEGQQLQAQQQQERAIDNAFDEVDRKMLKGFNDMSGINTFRNQDFSDLSIDEYQTGYENLVNKTIPETRNRLLQPIQDKFVEAIIANNKPDFDKYESDTFDKYNLSGMQNNIAEAFYKENKGLINNIELQLLKESGIPLTIGDDGKTYLAVDPKGENTRARLVEVNNKLNKIINGQLQQTYKSNPEYAEAAAKAQQEIDDYKNKIINDQLEKNYYFKRSQKRIDEHIKNQLEFIENKREEDEYGSGFTGEINKWRKLTMPSMIGDTETGVIKGIQEDLKKEQKRLQALDPNSTVYKEETVLDDFVGGYTKISVPIKVEKRLAEISREIEARDNQLVDRLINSVQYQKELALFDKPELFDKDGITLKDLKSVVGEQALNVFGALFSLGMYTASMEGTAVMRNTLATQAAKDMGISLEKFNRLPAKDQAEAMANVDDAKLGTALAVGLGAGSLDFLSTLTGAKAVVATMPRGLIRAFIRDGALSPSTLKVAGNTLREGAKTVGTAVAWEVPTEVGQDIISNIGTRYATGEGNIMPDSRELDELIGQTALSTILLVGGGLSVKNNAQLLFNFKKDRDGYIKSIDNLNKEYIFQKNQINKGLDPFNNNKELKTNGAKSLALKKLENNFNLGLEQLENANNFINDSKLKDLTGRRSEIVYEKYIENQKLRKEGIIAEINLNAVKEDSSSTQEDINAAQADLDFINENIEKNRRNILAQRAIDVANKKNKDIENSIVLDEDSDYDGVIFTEKETNKDLEKYLLENYGENRVKQDDIQNLLKGEVTGLKLVKKDDKGKTYLESVGSIENITNNIEKTGDVAAANYKKHEGLHMITDALSFKEGNKIRNEVMNELKDSTDPKMKQAYNNVKERMQGYKGFYKGKNRNINLMNEFFAALNDSLFDVEIRDISLNDKNILQKIGDIFTFTASNKTPIDFNKMTPSNALEFIKTYGDSQGTQFKAIKGKSKVETLASKPADIDKIYNELQQIDELESNFTITPDSRKRRQELQKQLQDEKVRPIYDELQAIDELEANFKITPESRARREELQQQLKNNALASKPVKQKLFQAIQSLVPEDINTKEDYQKFLSNPRQFNPLYNSITQQDGAINNYIKGVATSPEEFQLMVENVQDRVLAFNPEAERKDGGAVGIDAFVERIMSDTRFGKLDARKKLFEEGEKTKVQDKIDKPEARQIKAEEKTEPKRQVNLVLPKEIKDAAEVSIEPAILAGEKAIKDLPANATIKQKQRKINQAVNKIVKNRIDTAIKKGLLNKKNFPNFIDKNWEAIGNAYLNNTDITQLKKPNQLETREILQDWIDNGFTKEDVTEFFNDPSLSPQARSDRKNVGLVRALNTEIVNEAKVELAKRDPKTAADFKAKTGFALASKPLNQKTRTYLSNNPNAPQTLEYNNVKELLKANGESLPILNTVDGIKKFYRDVEPLVLLLPKQIALKKGLYRGSARGVFGKAITDKREGKPGATKESIKKYKDLVKTWDTEQAKLFEKIKNNPNQPEFFGAAGNGTSSVYIDTWGRTVDEITKNKKKGQAANVRNMAIHAQTWAPIYNAVKNDPKKYLSVAAQIVSASADTAANWHRLGAEMVAYSKDLSSGVRYEHAMPAKAAYLALLDSAAKGVPFDIAYPAVTKNYKVIALAKIDDDKLTGPYKSGMGKDWNFYDNSWLERYFNPTVAAIDGGIDPTSIVYFNGQTVQDIFKVNNNGRQNKALASKPLQKPTLDTEFNKMLERTKGIKAEAVYSEARAIKLGATKGWQAFVPYSNEDFMGLIYPTLGKGKQGDADLKWWTENVMDPYNQGIQNYETAKEGAMQQWKQLKNKIKNTPTGLKKKAVRGFTNEEAVRIYIWDNQNMTPENLAKKDITEIKKYINKKPELKAFADQLQTIIPDGYPQPSPGWLVGNITTDLINEINTVTRKEYLKPWREAIDLIYTKDNVNKLRATFGDKYVEALDDVLYRMDTGRNRPTGANRVTNLWLNWLNNSVGTTMFFNQRSSLLQTISSINFLNWTDNNPIMAAKAFGNQKQYWKDFATLFNSDFLKQRRSGLKTDVSADEIASAAAASKNKAVAALNELLKIGFISTQIADSFAIASGGATFYRNRINKYKKEGFSQKEAEEKAFFDFRNIAIESQQSSDPSRISMQQASQLGRIILSYANTPVQYARLIKKAASDLKNGRGDAKTNVSKILYYGALQNIIFTTLQSALFGIMFDEEDEEVGEKEAEFKKERKEGAPLRIVNGIVDTLLRGSGVGGAFVAMLKNILLEIDKQRKKTRPDFTYAADKIFSFSPTIDTKFRKALSAARKFTYKQELQKIYDRGVAIDNPALLAAGEIASAFVNIPADRVVKKLNNLKTATEEETKAWQSAALVWGYGEWELGIQARKTDEARAKAKKEKAKTKELKKDIKKLQKKVDKETKSPVKDKAGRILGRANKDGSIEVAPGLSPKKRAEVIRHERLHQLEMDPKNGSNAFTNGGKLDYNDDFVFYGKKKYPRKNGKIKDGNKWKHEGDHSLPWEVFAHKYDNVKTT